MEQNKFYQIKNITEHEYTLVGCDGSVITRPIQDVDRLASAFTIQDAKDGDVLAAKSGNRIFLYNGNCDLRHRPCAYCGIYKGFSEILFSKCAIGNYFTDEDVYPATKKQRDLLFQKMKEACYEWDAEKKELKPNNHVQWSDEEELHIKELESLVKKVWAIAERENDKDTIREMSDLSFFLKTLNPEKKGEQRPNPYSGTSFEYNGHTWGMCARDNGVEILIDGHLKGRVFTNDNNAKEMFIKALERVEEENAKGYKLTDCDKNSWWEDFKTYTSCTIGQKSIDDLTPQEAMDIAVAKCFEQGEQKHADNIESSAFKDKLLELFQKFRYIKEGVPTNGDIIEYVDAHIQELINTIQNNAWSEEDENWLIDAINVCELNGYNETAGWLKNRFKSLKDRVQTKQEWSEEDKRSIRDSIFYLKSAKKYFEKDDDILWNEKWFNLCIKFLESLYKKLQPQSQWKPSEEQMNALDSALQYSQVSHNSFEYLNSLFNDLKKLREE